MLTISILGSGSKGNSIYVGNGASALLIDAGLSWSQTKARLTAAGLDYRSIKAIALTHEHTDHSRSLGILSRALKVPVMITRAAFGAISERLGEPYGVEFFSAGETIEVGAIRARSFSVPHDALDPVAFRLDSNGIGALALTDLGELTEEIERIARGVQYMALESNHQIQMLRSGPYPIALKRRIESRLGHLSNEAAAEFLRGHVERGQLRALAMAHLSEINNHPALVEQMTLKSLAGSKIEYQIATQTRPTRPVRID